MSVRFATVKDLCVSFPTIEADLQEDPTDEGSVLFVRRCLIENKPEKALAFCAYLLPKRTAVDWACDCLAGLQALTDREQECVAVAREWVARPEEAVRRKALDTGLETSARLSGAWVALAAGWSGGSIAPPDAPPTPPAPAATAQAVRVALLSAAPRLAEPQRPGMLTAWVEGALQKLTGGPGR